VRFHTKTASRRTVLGALALGSGLAVAVVSILAREPGLGSGSGVHLRQVLGLLLFLGALLVGASLLERPPLLVVSVGTVLLVALLDAWTTRHLIGPDGVSYLDIGDAYLGGHISGAVNAYWNPLYPVLAGTALAILPVSPSTQFAIVHGVNLVIFLAALGAFAFFLEELIRYREATLPRERGAPLLPAGLLRVVGVVAFGWGVARLIGVAGVTPDLLVAVFWFTAMGLLLRCIRAPEGVGTPIALGLVLGLGYLTKTAMLPIALSFLAVVASAGPLRRSLRRASIAAVALAVVSIPYVAAISERSGSLTIGTSSQLTYAWYVHGTPPFAHLPNDTSINGLRHNPRKLLDSPPTFAFDRPAEATFPLWYDPTYWYAGTKARFDLGAQVRTLRHNGRAYLDMIRDGAGLALTIGFVVLMVVLWRIRSVRRLVPFARVLVPAAFGLVMYAGVHVEGRFVGAFLATIAVIAYSFLPWSTHPRKRFPAVGVLAAVTVVGLWSIAATPIRWATNQEPAVEAAQRSASNDEVAAAALQRLGLRHCRRIAVVAPSNVLVQTYLPRLAGMRIVASVTRPPPRWSVSPNLRSALTSSRVMLLIARGVPATEHRTWLRLGSSDYSASRVVGSLCGQL
jgi:hypothetical protein